MTTTDNLSEKGLSFFLDKDLKYELIQDAVVNMRSGETIEFYIASRYTTSAEFRLGKIFVLEEEFRTLMVDMIKESGGQYFRSYDAIESILLSIEFDTYELTRNILISKSSYSVFNILEMLSRGITVDEKAYEVCVYENTNRIIPCDREEARNIFRAEVTDYNFFKDFFLTEKDGEVSVWDKWRAHMETRNAIIRYYFDHGFNKIPEMAEKPKISYNYYNNIYPEQTQLLNYRWHGNGYDVSEFEMRQGKTFIYNKMLSWYNGGDQAFGASIIPVLTQNSDWKYKMYSSSGDQKHLYRLYDGVLSTVKGQNDMVFGHIGHITIEFPQQVALGRFTGRQGAYETAQRYSPRHLYIDASNDEVSWTRLVYTYNAIFPSNGGLLTMNIPTTKEYKFYRFGWLDTYYSGYPSVISDIQWHGKFHVEKNYNYDADEKTVKYFTDIAKTEIYDVFKRDEPILISLLGPAECIQYKDGYCVRARYGEIDSTPPAGEEWPPPSDEVFGYLEGDWDENSFLMVRPSTFTSVASEMVSSGSFRNQIYTYGLSPEDAFYAVFYFSGMVGGQHVYNAATGNEYRYAMRFDEFLKEQKWTIDDFMEIYSDHVNAFRKGLYESAIEGGCSIHPKDYCEFYDVNHRSPFDNIRVYIPKPPVVGDDFRFTDIVSKKVEVTKSKAVFDVHGDMTIETVEMIEIEHEQIDIPMNKDEFVSSVSVPNSLRVVISDFMRIKAEITLKDSFNDENNIRLRISTNDFTYLSMRDFLYV